MKINIWQWKSCLPTAVEIDHYFLTCQQVMIMAENAKAPAIPCATVVCKKILDMCFRTLVVKSAVMPESVVKVKLSSAMSGKITSSVVIIKIDVPFSIYTDLRKFYDIFIVK